MPSVPLEHACVIELCLVGEHVAVGVRCNGEVPLPDVLADPRPRYAPEVEQRDPAVPQVVRREGRDPGGGAGASHRRSESVAAEAQEDAAVGDAVVAGMRLGELERLTWGDLDEQRQRWRVSRAVSKTGRAGWVGVPPVLFEAVCELVPRKGPQMSM